MEDTANDKYKDWKQTNKEIDSLLSNFIIFEDGNLSS